MNKMNLMIAYLRHDLIHLKGNRYAKQKHLIHQFYKRYSQVQRRNRDIDLLEAKGLLIRTNGAVGAFGIGSPSD